MRTTHVFVVSAAISILIIAGAAVFYDTTQPEDPDHRVVKCWWAMHIPNVRCYGTKSFSNGNLYIGEFKNGEYNGNGRFTSLNGFEYFGKYKDGYYDGKGTYTWNGVKYTGDFSRGK